ncbi:MAG: hypothetical protein HQ485_03655 [Acidobacteria bacterium]|jgi:hypothetical protein|nr:hypothetical protein [Acidobacteriota bacterium]
MSVKIIGSLWLCITLSGFMTGAERPSPIIVEPMAQVSQGLPQPPRRPGATKAISDSMTADQKVHAKLHSKFTTGGLILDDGFMVDIKVHTAGETGSGRSSSQAIRELTCTADTVFLGQVVGQTVLPTTDGSFLLTDYAFHVNELLKTSSKSTPGQNVTVTRPGGIVMRGEVQVGAVISTWPVLESGRAYLIFGTTVPETGAFLSIVPVLFEVEGDKMKSTVPLRRVEDSAWHEGIPVSAIRAFVKTAKCGGEG